MSAPFTLATLPFAAQEPLELLGFRPGRRAPDHDYAGFGHAWVPSITLIGEGDAVVVRDARVLALHSADDGAPLADDVELEFWIDDETALVALLSRFLAARAPALEGGAAALVLALCNPHRARLRRPPGVDAPIHYALGDVVARLRADHPGPWSIDQVTLELHAERWLLL